MAIKIPTLVAREEESIIDENISTINGDIIITRILEQKIDAEYLKTELNNLKIRKESLTNELINTDKLISKYTNILGGI